MADAKRSFDAREHLSRPRQDVPAMVRVETDLYGSGPAVRLRRIAPGNAFLETADLLPFGTRVRIGFTDRSGVVNLVATGTVRHHYFINHVDDQGLNALAGMEVRFEGFFGGEVRTGEALH